MATIGTRTERIEIGTAVVPTWLRQPADARDAAELDLRQRAAGEVGPDEL